MGVFVAANVAGGSGGLPVGEDRDGEGAARAGATGDGCGVVRRSPCCAAIRFFGPAETPAQLDTPLTTR